MISQENREKINQMKCVAWRKVAAQASIVQASTPGVSRDTAVKYLLDLFDEEKHKIDRAIDKMPDV